MRSMLWLGPRLLANWEHCLLLLSSSLLPSPCPQRESPPSGTKHGISLFLVQQQEVPGLFGPQMAAKKCYCDNHGETWARKCSVTCRALWKELLYLEGPPIVSPSEHLGGTASQQVLLYLEMC